MDYEKKYKEANDKVVARFGSNVAKEIFTDLYESEDEKIRKALIRFHKSTIDIDGIKGNEIVAWLEQQGESYTKRDVDNAYLKGISDAKNELEKQCEHKLPIEKLPSEMKTIGESLGFTTQEECDEYNQMVSDLIMSDNKDKPKFKDGDWIVDSIGVVHKIERTILNVTNNTFGYDIVGGGYFNDDSDVHLWSIKDAKKGDVLAMSWCEDGNSWEKIIIFKKYHNKGVKGLYNMSCVEGYGNTFKNGKLAINDEVPYYSKTWTCNLHPATKEQRDILFQKMKEAGYEWDSENKELKKIEQKPIDKVEPKFKVKYAGNEYNVFDIKASMGIIWYGIEDEPNHIDYIKADSCEIISGISGCSKPTDNDMKETLRTEYEKGRADAIAEMQVAWSEEDERERKRVVGLLEGWLSTFKETCYAEDCKCGIEWLKSLKERYTWKPSDEQIKAFEHFVRSIEESGYASPYENNTKLLYSLLNDLKKLTE